jgi:hypothetical protein
MIVRLRYQLLRGYLYESWQISFGVLKIWREIRGLLIGNFFKVLYRDFVHNIMIV